MKTLKEQSEYLHDTAAELMTLANNHSDLGVSVHLPHVSNDCKKVSRRIDTHIRKSLNSIYNSIENL